MASLHEGEKRRLYCEFIWQGKVYRPTVAPGVKATKENYRKYEKLRKDVTHAVDNGTFTFAEFFPDSKAAKEEKAEAAVAAANGPDWTVWGQAQAHNATVKVKMEKSRKGYLRALRKFLEGTELGRMDVRSPLRDLRLAIEAAIKDCPHGRTVTVFLQQLRKMFETLVNDEIISKNPAAAVDNPPANDKEDIVYPLPADQEKIIAAALTLFGVLQMVIIEVGRALGPRPSELLGLLWEDMAGILKGDLWLRIRGTKTTAADRTIKVSPEIAAKVVAALRKLPMPIDRKGYIFRSPLGRKLILNNWRRRFWDKIVAAADLDYPVTPNALRHIFAIENLEGGNSSREVAAWMGDHHDTVLRNYSRSVFAGAAKRKQAVNQ